MFSTGIYLLHISSFVLNTEKKIFQIRFCVVRFERQHQQRTRSYFTGRIWILNVSQPKQLEMSDRLEESFRTNKESKSIRTQEKDKTHLFCYF